MNKNYRLQSHAALKREMKAVARGARPASAHAAVSSFNSVGALLRLLTPENRELLAIIRKRRPQSIAELAKLTGRAAPNVTRTLGKLAAAGFVRLETVEKRKIPKTLVQTLRLRIDPFSMNDRLEVA
jgi:predicted transcriptional regulator